MATVVSAMFALLLDRFKALPTRGVRPAKQGGIVAAKSLMVLSASIMLTLGVVHLVYTFYGTKLTPRDPALQISMARVHQSLRKKQQCGSVGWASTPATAWHLFCSGWFSVFSRWLTANSSFSHRSGSLSGWQRLEVLSCSARFIFSVCLSQASAFLWPAMSQVLRYRGPSDALLTLPCFEEVVNYRRAMHRGIDRHRVGTVIAIARNTHRLRKRD